MLKQRFQKSVCLSRGRLAVGVALGAVALVGCGSSTGEAGSTSAGPTSADTPRTVASGREVRVTMREWTVEPSTTTAPPGQVTFKAENVGGNTHELAVFKTELPAESLPKDEDGAVDERGAGVELVDEVEDVKPGETGTFTVDLAPGNYYLVCNLVDASTGDNHFAHKMYVPFRVA